MGHWSFLLSTLAFGTALAHPPSNGWQAKSFKTIVTFGDSYTDENRLGYFINNKSPPPVGWDAGVVSSTSIDADFFNLPIHTQSWLDSEFICG